MLRKYGLSGLILVTLDGMHCINFNILVSEKTIQSNSGSNCSTLNYRHCVDSYEHLLFIVTDCIYSGKK